MRRLLVLLALIAAPALAQEWPNRPVRIVVPSSPGGGTDVYARLLAQALGDSLKQQFVVENRPGASGNIGAAAVAKAAPDGYTFLVSANPALSVNPSLYRNLPYNAERELAPVTRGVMAPMVLVVNPCSQRLPRFPNWSRWQRTGKLAYGSAGTGSPTFLGVRMLEETVRREIHARPVQGGRRRLLGSARRPDPVHAPRRRFGHRPHPRRQAARARGQPGRRRCCPGVPTLAQAGFPLDVFTSFSVVAPAGTPEPVLARLGAEIARAMRSARWPRSSTRRHWCRCSIRRPNSPPA